MNDFAAIDDRNTVTIVRDLPGPVERVWAFLTEPNLISRWFSDGVVADHVGGEVRFEMGADGRVTIFDPPHVLEFTWNERDHSRGPIFDSIVRWELTGVGNRVRLTLTHKHLCNQEAIQHGAGWHTFVDRLADSLDGRELPDIMDRFALLQTAYEQRFGVNPKLEI